MLLICFVAVIMKKKIQQNKFKMLSSPSNYLNNWFKDFCHRTIIDQINSVKQQKQQRKASSDQKSRKKASAKRA